MRWWYMRNVPTNLKNLDNRFPKIQLSLKTRDIYEARQQRDIQEQADNALWKALHSGVDAKTEKERYDASIKINHALMYDKPDAVSLSKMELIRRSLKAHSITPVQRTEMAEVEVVRIDGRTGLPVDDIEVHEVPIMDNTVLNALTGKVSKPADMLSELLDIYINNLAKDEWRHKSPNQAADWKKWPRVAIAELLELIGDKEVMNLNREDARRYYNQLKEWRNTPRKATGKPPSASSANRKLGVLRKIFGKYADDIDEIDYDNPFTGLSFTDRKVVRKPVKLDDIKSSYLNVKIMSDLNEEARAILLITLETGARLSEIANLQPEHIHLTHNIPYISIKPVDDGVLAREVKTSSSIRDVPLVGVALHAMRKFPSGFPRYWDKGSTLSTTIGKYMRDREVNGEAGVTAVHSLRHSFKDRMREAEIDETLIKLIQGHAEQGVVYGSGFSLVRKQKAIEAIALPFDPAII